jgi:phosphate transport system protein
MSTAHIYSVFDDELKHLARRIAEMGGMAEQMVSDSIHALVTSDAALAQRVISEDAIIDATEREIDLREIIGSIRIAADLERVGDLGKSNAKRVIAVQSTGIPRPLARGIEHLSELALSQLKDVLDVYSTRSPEKAEQIRARDEEIDAMYTSLFRELLTYMMEDPRNITPCTHLLFCAKNIERIGDHATNIAETIYYMSTGEQPAGERPKDDNTASVVQPAE